MGTQILFLCPDGSDRTNKHLSLTFSHVGQSLILLSVTETFFQITGIVMRAAKRIQINIAVEPVKMFA